jgi:hypothetical protein
MSNNMIRVDSNNHWICVDSSNHWVRVDSNKICRIGHPCNESREKKTVKPAFLHGRTSFGVAERRKQRVDCPETSGDLLPPSPPAEQAATRQDQAGKASTGDGAGNA